MSQSNTLSMRQLPLQCGFSLVETLVAALLLTVSLLGLLQYHQVLQESFLHQWQQRQAWQQVVQQLEAYDAGVTYTMGFNDNTGPSHGVNGNSASVIASERGWQSSLSEQRITAECRKVTATMITPRNYQAQLTRWFCQSAQSASE
ncbi:prepilin-type N-terminal cleavage/methylation domain-containing protein [Pectobacterium sp. B1J-3]|uniref:prepilin-type N-terminal cleavage/methylation domain-containing protein n=1 Tax=Pectobacterium sp. B1J-3 TaxID=3385371 RepID=UPI003905D4FE